MKILEVQNLSKIYGKGENQINALKNVSFVMEKGEFAAIVGESGSGKSTLLNCVGAAQALPISPPPFLSPVSFHPEEAGK